MAIINDLLYNAALCGFISGCVDGRVFTTAAVTADGAEILAAAQSFATSVDALIAEDATITTGTGDASQLAPSTSAIASATQWKGALMFSIAKSITDGRYALDATAGFYATPAAAVAALYTATVGGITNAA